MDLKRLEAQGFIEKGNFSGGQITSNLNRAQRDLRTAKANLKIDEEWAYTIAYHAWGLLKNLVHLLLFSGAAGLPLFMRRLLTQYVQGFNRRHKSTGGKKR